MTAFKPADAVLGQLMLAFEGHELPGPMADRLRSRPSAGITLFRSANVDRPVQLRALTDAIQACAPPGLPFLVAVDQETGQLLGLGADSTPFAGAMALGAVGDVELAERVGAAIGRELRVAGVNVNYAPVCDLAVDPANPGLGVRSFGDDPDAAGRMVAALVRGHAASGVATTLKHFPGIGALAADTHLGPVAVGADAPTLRTRELVPFRAGIEAGVGLVMAGHASVPALGGPVGLPATSDPAVARGLLRDELGFGGVAISDAFNMRALAQGDAGRAIEAVAALRAGLDLLLLASPDEALDDALVLAAGRGLLPSEGIAESVRRVVALRRSLYPVPADLSVIGSAEHRELAAELARRSITLVRDDAGLLPLRLAPGTEVVVIMPRPSDLTPADTSSTISPALADAIRRHHPRVTGHLVAHEPSSSEIVGAREAARDADVLVIGTISASLAPAQIAMVEALLVLGRPTVTVALRTPWDLDAYPSSLTHVCTYSILGPSLDALADALVGRAPFTGRLPVRTRTAVAS